MAILSEDEVRDFAELALDETIIKDLAETCLATMAKADERRRLALRVAETENENRELRIDKERLSLALADCDCQKGERDSAGYISVCYGPYGRGVLFDEMCRPCQERAKRKEQSDGNSK